MVLGVGILAGTTSLGFLNYLNVFRRLWLRRQLNGEGTRRLLLNLGTSGQLKFSSFLVVVQLSQGNVALSSAMRGMLLLLLNLFINASEALLLLRLRTLFQKVSHPSPVYFILLISA